MFGEEWDSSLMLGMAASLVTCASVTGLTIFYRVRRLRVERMAG
jgi:hypothetical protein